MAYATKKVHGTRACEHVTARTPRPDSSGAWKAMKLARRPHTATYSGRPISKPSPSQGGTLQSEQSTGVRRRCCCCSATRRQLRKRLGIVTPFSQRATAPAAANQFGKALPEVERRQAGKRLLAASHHCACSTPRRCRYTRSNRTKKTGRRGGAKLHATWRLDQG